jgi:cell division septal protein FtsQ
MKRKVNRHSSRNARIVRRKKVRENPKLNVRRITARISGILAVLSLACLLAYLVVSFLKSQEFPVKDIRFEGTGHLDRMALCRRGNISRDSNLLTMDLREVKARLLSEPYIEEAVVSRNFCTGTVTIKAKLRKPAALINCDGLYGVDKHGVVIGGIGELSQSDLPLISGVRVQGIKPGKKLEEKDLKMALEILDYISLSNLDSFAPLSEINVGNLKNVILYVGKDGMQILLGKDGFNEKINKATVILADLRSRGKEAHYIDFRFGKKIIVKPKK